MQLKDLRPNIPDLTSFRRLVFLSPPYTRLFTSIVVVAWFQIQSFTTYWLVFFFLSIFPYYEVRNRISPPSDGSRRSPLLWGWVV